MSAGGGRQGGRRQHVDESHKRKRDSAVTKWTERRMVAMTLSGVTWTVIDGWRGKKSRNMFGEKVITAEESVEENGSGVS